MTEKDLDQIKELFGKEIKFYHYRLARTKEDILNDVTKEWEKLDKFIAANRVEENSIGIGDIYDKDYLNKEYKSIILSIEGLFLRKYGRIIKCEDVATLASLDAIATAVMIIK